VCACVQGQTHRSLKRIQRAEWKYLTRTSTVHTPSVGPSVAKRWNPSVFTRHYLDSVPSPPPPERPAFSPDSDPGKQLSNTDRRSPCQSRWAKWLVKLNHMKMRLRCEPYVWTWFQVHAAVIKEKRSRRKTPKLPDIGTLVYVYSNVKREVKFGMQIAMCKTLSISIPDFVFILR
jgi:hypothetical protein